MNKQLKPIYEHSSSAVVELQRYIEQCEEKPKRLISNCLFYALKQWLFSGGYLIIRRSRWGWWPHFLHGKLDETGRLVVDHLVPIEPVPPIGWRRWIPLHTLRFRGIIRSDDKPSS